jgi:hypothetical protein
MVSLFQILALIVGLGLSIAGSGALPVPHGAGNGGVVVPQDVFLPSGG